MLRVSWLVNKNTHVANMDVLSQVLLSLLGLLFFYNYLKSLQKSFELYGIKHYKTIPIVTEFVEWMAHILRLRPKHEGLEYAELYNSFPGERFVGRYEYFQEKILIRDTELLEFTTKIHYRHFINRSSGEHPYKNYATNNLYHLRASVWESMRCALSPAFSSWKIRLMLPFMMEVGDKMILSLKKKLEDSRNDYIDVDCKDLTNRFANDVIASCAFGVKVDSHSDRNNEFYMMGRIVTENNSIKVIVGKILRLIGLLQYTNYKLTPQCAENYFQNLVSDTLKEREQGQTVRPDMIQMLLEIKQRKLSHEYTTPKDDDAGFATVEESELGRDSTQRATPWKDHELVPQPYMFFVSGYETMSSSMSFLLYELAVNPDVQERLAQEIREHDDKNGGKFDFSSVQGMKYLDMVVSEVLRKWPAHIYMERDCNATYNFGTPNNASPKDYWVGRDQTVLIPVLAFHRDPKYYPDPEKFDPERFSEENKHNINAMTYMPFGFGPRNCVASRFALCEMKVMAYQILRHMEVSPNKWTCIPAKLDPYCFYPSLQGGHWLRFSLRK